MKSRVFYQPTTGWITIHISDYHAWQGHISDVPYMFKEMILFILTIKETIVTEKVT